MSDAEVSNAPKLSLYVWVDPYQVGYGSSLFFAIAADVDEARRIAKAAMAYSYGQYEKTIPEIDLGEPSRVLPAPCGEWHEWSE